MSNIQSLIEMLQSDNPNKRYDACEELRVLMLREPLPREAIDALHTATNDSNPDVADAAQRALKLQDSVQSAETYELSESPLTNWGATKSGMKIGFIPILITFIIWSLILRHPMYGMVFVVIWGTLLGLPGGIIGALIGKKWKNTWNATQAGGIFGTILGIVLWHLLIKLSGFEYGGFAW